MKRIIPFLSLAGIALLLTGCVVSVGSRVETPAPAVTDDADKATIAEINAAANLNLDNHRAAALGQIARRPVLSAPVQLHLINVACRSITFDNHKASVLSAVIARPDFSDAARHAIVSQLNRLTFDSNRQAILAQINARQQQPRVAPAVVQTASVGAAPVSASPAQPAPAAVSEPRTNTAIVPVGRPDAGARRRTDIVLQRAKDNPGECDIAFIGDSITQGWEGAGRNVWTNFYGGRKCLNFGVGGDRTQHVLWRFEQGQLDGIKPKAAVLMIGTNNSNRDDHSEADILEGVQTIVKQIRQRLPETKVLVLGIFPRSRNFNAQRGKILQVNQALAKIADGKMIHYLDFGSQLIESDGSISTAIMPDALHLSERGYQIWAEAMEPKLKELLGN